MNDRTEDLQPILDRLAQGDSRAKEELIQRSQERLRRLARKMLRCEPRIAAKEQTDDVLQTSLLKLYRSLESVKPETVKGFIGLAATHMRRELVNLARHHYGPHGDGRHQVPVGAKGDDEDQGQPLLEKEAPEIGLTTLAEWQNFHEKIKELPDEEKVIFDCLYYQEMSQEDIRQDKIDAFNEQMLTYRAELHEAVASLDDHYAELKSAARRRLGDLFNAADYPPSLRGLFDLAWEFPNVSPPEYLMQLNPALYDQEKARIASRFEEAVRLAEEAFVSEFASLVSHLCERLNSDGTGERKVFRDSIVTNLGEFFDRFRQLNVHSNDQLDTLVEEAQRLVRGVEPQALRANETLRQHVATQLSSVQAVLDGMMVDRPRRNIIRNRSEGGES